MPRPLLLQLCPFSEWMEARFLELFDVCRLYDVADEDAWLDAHAPQVVAVATGGHIGIANALMARLPALGIVAINGVGFDKVDLDAARARGIRVTATPDVLTDDVADLAVGLTIGLLRELASADAYVRAGSWPGGNMPLARTVTGRTFGIVGLGRIGHAIAKRLDAFGPVLYTDLEDKHVPFAFIADLHALASQSNVLILASSANAATRHLVDGEVLDALGADGYLVNVARGSLVDEDALVTALQEGRIAGAALDVFADEPHVPPALMQSRKVLLTPHIASATVETRQRMAQLVIDNLRAFLAGTPLPTALV